MNTHGESNESHGMTLLVRVFPDTDVDTLVSHVKAVVHEIVAATADNLAMTGIIEITNECLPPLDPEPAPETDSAEYKLPSGFGE